MSLKADIAEARKALDKLNTYMDGVFAAGGRDATKKYYELNSKADKAIRKLPDGVMRSRMFLELSKLILK